MKKLLFLCFIFLSLNTHALDSNKLINLDDLKILFDLQKNDWNENVLFLIKKNSFSKVDNDSDVFYLKSIFNDGEIITMPIFSKDIVEKIIFEYKHFDGYKTTGKKLEEILKKFDQNNYSVSKIDEENILAEKL